MAETSTSDTLDRLVENESQNKGTILLVDDNLDVILPIETYLVGEGYDVLMVSNGQEALDAIAENEPDLVITDLKMPKVSGEELLKQTSAQYPDLPVVVMSGITNEEYLQRLVIEQGAANYMQKPFDMERVGYIVEKELRTARKLERWQKQAKLDRLTGLPRGWFVRDILEQRVAEVNRAVRGGDRYQPFSIVMFDVDRFKRINDTQGHAKGDEVLKGVAHALDEATHRSSDLIGRWYQGDEFVAIISGRERAAEKYVDRVNERIKQEKFVNGSEFTMSLSAGIAEYDPLRNPEVTHVGQLLELADKNMYEEKRNSRGSFWAKTYQLWCKTPGKVAGKRILNRLGDLYHSTRRAM